MTRIFPKTSIAGLIVLLSLFFQAPNALSQDSRPFLWKVQSKTATAYLLGSIHFLKKEAYPLNRKMEEAFDRSDFLVVEANIDDVGQVDPQSLAEKALYLDEETLKNHVSGATYELVKKRMGGLGLPPEFIDKQKPWFLALTLTTIEYLKLGLDPNYGIDKYFLSKAQGKKKVIELESLAYQINLLSRLSDQDQERFLLLTLMDMDALGKEMDPLLQAWKSGDAGGLERIMTQSMTPDGSLSSIYEILIYDRNKKMVPKIEDLLKNSETYFVVVGAAHLVGKRGIIEILRTRGYVVEQM